jgi:hypothetical protein
LCHPQNHRFTYDSPMGVEATTQSICDLALGFGESRGEKNIRTTIEPYTRGAKSCGRRIIDGISLRLSG